MGTKRRVRHHRKRYRGGEEFVERPFVMPTGANPRAIGALKARHLASEKARYEDWKKSREVEAREDAKGREEDAKMADFYKKQKKERAEELIKTAQQREETDIESTRAADEKARRSECRSHLRSHDPSLSTPKAAKEWLADKTNMRANPQDYKEVRDCLRILTAAKDGAGRRTRRRKSHRRR